MVNKKLNLLYFFLSLLLLVISIVALVGVYLVSQGVNDSVMNVINNTQYYLDAIERMVQVGKVEDILISVGAMWATSLAAIFEIILLIYVVKSLIAMFASLNFNREEDAANVRMAKMLKNASSALISVALCGYIGYFASANKISYSFIYLLSGLGIGFISLLVKDLHGLLNNKVSLSDFILNTIRNIIALALPAIIITLFQTNGFYESFTNLVKYNRATKGWSSNEQQAYMTKYIKIIYASVFEFIIMLIVFGILNKTIKFSLVPTTTKRNKELTVKSVVTKKYISLLIVSILLGAIRVFADAVFNIGPSGTFDFSNIQPVEMVLTLIKSYGLIILLSIGGIILTSLAYSNELANEEA